MKMEKQIGNENFDVRVNKVSYGKFIMFKLIKNPHLFYSDSLSSSKVLINIIDKLISDLDDFKREIENE